MEENHVSNIMCWLRQRFGKPRNQLDQGNPSKHSQMDNSTLSNSNCSRGQSNCKAHCRSSCSPESSVSSSFPSEKSSIAAKSSSSEQPLPSVLFSSFRSTRSYDICVCHNDKDTDQAQSLSSFLEDASKGLRCYLQERDCPLGGAVSSELLQAVHDSHCWVLLITPNFLNDDWCLYQMHQVLSEGPMSQRIIPAVLNMPRSELPQELRFVFTVDLNENKEVGYKKVYKTVIHYLKDMLEKERFCKVSEIGD
ncbi:toll/interleukin-1 receptor domain-containing adapter protein-like [Myxocyprinus asiaticus]|uniref:toll/interleukin-1 receptor domain-containing adapter protein-like n=1 Tax=Myxocyprinus asiaticus TaxID=70543 RepID=UPI0022219CCD|nr:toll/interleukin-1 receptor domain-containing adapter protein-like [Myxocyprinus asiaticus]XP_051513477.1 toll/interleukin-1 receptor domain-containing adapter protein-like [Myxocyprinus asiaticus]